MWVWFCNLKLHIVDLPAGRKTVNYNCVLTGIALKCYTCGSEEPKYRDSSGGKCTERSNWKEIDCAEKCYFANSEVVIKKKSKWLKSKLNF